MKRLIKLVAGFGLAATLGACSSGSADEKVEKNWPGEKLFADNCLGCHGGASPKAPSPNILGLMLPDTILDALNHGVMKANAAHLKPEERVQIAEYLTKTSMADYTPPAPPVMWQLMKALRAPETTRPPISLASVPPFQNITLMKVLLVPEMVIRFTL